MDSTAEHCSPHIDIKVQPVRESEIVKESGTGSEFIVDIIRFLIVTVSAEIACMQIRHEIPETGLLVAAQGIRHVPEEVSVDIHETEFLGILVFVSVQSTSENSRLI